MLTNGYARGSTAEIQCQNGFELTIQSSKVMVCGEQQTQYNGTHWLTQGVWRTIDGREALFPPVCEQVPWCEPINVPNSANIEPRLQRRLEGTVDIVCILGYHLSFDQSQFKATCSDSRKFEIGYNSNSGSFVKIACVKNENWCLDAPTASNALQLPMSNGVRVEDYLIRPPEYT